jgi:hypothetical protein
VAAWASGRAPLTGEDEIVLNRPSRASKRQSTFWLPEQRVRSGAAARARWCGCSEASAVRPLAARAADARERTDDDVYIKADLPGGASRGVASALPLRPARAADRLTLAAGSPSEEGHLGRLGRAIVVVGGQPKMRVNIRVATACCRKMLMGTVATEAGSKRTCAAKALRLRTTGGQAGRGDASRSARLTDLRIAGDLDVGSCRRSAKQRLSSLDVDGLCVGSWQRAPRSSRARMGSYCAKLSLKWSRAAGGASEEYSNHVWPCTSTCQTGAYHGR